MTARPRWPPAAGTARGAGDHRRRHRRGCGQRVAGCKRGWHAARCTPCGRRTAAPPLRAVCWQCKTTAGGVSRDGVNQRLRGNQHHCIYDCTLTMSLMTRLLVFQCTGKSLYSYRPCDDRVTREPYRAARTTVRAGRAGLLVPPAHCIRRAQQSSPGVVVCESSLSQPSNRDSAAVGGIDFLLPTSLPLERGQRCSSLPPHILPHLATFSEKTRGPRATARPRLQ